MVFEDKYYRILELTSEASEDDLKRSYRKLAKKFHPDKNPDGAEKFKEISMVYSVLSDPDKRKLYDLKGEKGVNRSGAKQQQNKAEECKRAASSEEDDIDSDNSEEESDDEEFIKQTFSYGEATFSSFSFKQTFSYGSFSYAGAHVQRRPQHQRFSNPPPASRSTPRQVPRNLQVPPRPQQYNRQSFTPRGKPQEKFVDEEYLSDSDSEEENVPSDEDLEEERSSSEEDDNEILTDSDEEEPERQMYTSQRGANISDSRFNNQRRFACAAKQDIPLDSDEDEDEESDNNDGIAETAKMYSAKKVNIYQEQRFAKLVEEDVTNEYEEEEADMDDAEQDDFEDNSDEDLEEVPTFGKMKNFDHEGSSHHREDEDSETEEDDMIDSLSEESDQEDASDHEESDDEEYQRQLDEEIKRLEEEKLKRTSVLINDEKPKLLPTIPSSTFGSKISYDPRKIIITKKVQEPGKTVAPEANVNNSGLNITRASSVKTNPTTLPSKPFPSLKRINIKPKPEHKVPTQTSVLKEDQLKPRGVSKPVLQITRKETGQSAKIATSSSGLHKGINISKENSPKSVKETSLQEKANHVQHQILEIPKKGTANSVIVPKKPLNTPPQVPSQIKIFPKRSQESNVSSNLKITKTNIQPKINSSLIIQPKIKNTSSSVLIQPKAVNSTLTSANRKQHSSNRVNQGQGSMVSQTSGQTKCKSSQPHKPSPKSVKAKPKDTLDERVHKLPVNIQPKPKLSPAPKSPLQPRKPVVVNSNQGSKSALASKKIPIPKVKDQGTPKPTVQGPSNENLRVSAKQNSLENARQSVITRPNTEDLSKGSSKPSQGTKRKQQVIQEASKKSKHVINLGGNYSVPWKVPVSRQGHKNVILV